MGLKLNQNYKLISLAIFRVSGKMIILAKGLKNEF